METFIKAYRQRFMAAVLALLAVLALVTSCADDSKEDKKEENAVSEEQISTDEVSAPQAAGYGVYIDGSFVAALENKESASSAIDSVTAVLADVYGAPDGMHSLYNDVRIVNGYFNTDAFTTEVGLRELLGDKGNFYDFTATDIYGIPLNTELSVITNTVESVDAVIKHSKNIIKTDALSVGESVTVTEGADGMRNEIYGVTYVNGVCTESVLQNTIVSVEPVDSEIWQGTEKAASLMAAGEKLAIPYDGRVSSWYGYRTVFGRVEFHNGVDFIAHSGSCYGDTITAAADGVVVFSDWHSGYGLKVVVDHGDGLSTLYAHCSKSLVSVGDVVLKGQPVALIGSTGRVTGPHLHFGVVKNGVEVNPELYLDWSTYNGSK